MSVLMILSLYSSYYFYYQSIPFDPIYFGISSIMSALFCIMNLNAAIARTITIVEMFLLPSKDRVKFILYSGNTLEAWIKDVNIKRKNENRLLLEAKLDKKVFKIILDTKNPYDYFN